MRLLLDTQIIFWTYYESGRLPDQARQMMETAEEVFVSPASIWEISIKILLGRINADVQLLITNILASGVQELPVTFNHTLEVARLPQRHTDPFDRLLIAQSIHEKLHLVTTDAVLPQYSDLVILV